MRLFFGCARAEFPNLYLGILIHYRTLMIAVEERMQKRLSSWKGKYLSTQGRLVLINSVLTTHGTLYALLFSWHPNVSYRGLTIISADIIGKVISKRKIIDYQNGISCVAQKIRMVWESII